MATENKSNEYTPVDITEILERVFRVFRRLWILVVIFALLGGAFFAIRAKRSYVPVYVASAFFSVDSGYSDSDIFNSSYYDSKLADQLAESFPYLLSTGTMTDLMRDHLGGNINGSVSAASVASTGMFVMNAKSTDPQDAYDVLWAAIECYPQVASYMVDDPQIILREEPTVPTEPAIPFSYKAPALKGAMLGGAGAMAIILLLALAVRRINGVEQLKSALNRPVISALPLVRVKKRRNVKESFVMAATDSGLAEAFRGMTHKVQKKLDSSGGKVVLVTSTLKNEGKTTVATNLALAMVREGHRVVIVDADIRNQSVAERLNCEKSSKNLLGLMRDSKAEVMSAVKRAEDTEGLYYISSDSTEGNRYSIEHSAMTSIISALKDEFDYVVIDTPPCGIVADTALLCRYTDLVLYVVRADFAPEIRIIDTVNSLCDRGGSVDAFVFNGTESAGRRYGYGYCYGYGYGYGNKYGSRKNR